MTQYIFAPPGEEPVLAGPSILETKYPSTFFPPFMTDGDREDFYLYAVQEVPPPPFNPATQRLQSAEPALIDGKWTQQWQVIDLTQEEREIYKQSTNPPKWTEFAFEISSHPLVNQWLDDMPRGIWGIFVGSMVTAKAGDPSALIQALQQAKQNESLPTGIVTILKDRAVANDLPKDLLAVFD